MIYKNITHPFLFGKDKLIFTHIPKSGGTSIHHSFEQIFGDRYRMFSQPKDQKDISTLYAGGGHQRYGANPIHTRTVNPYYVTIIRDPFERLFSFYNHVRYIPHHHLYKKIPNIKRCSFYDFLNHLISIENLEFRNLMASMLAPNCTDINDIIQTVENNYTIIGFTEDMNAFSTAIKEMFPNHLVQIPYLNKRKKSEVLSLDGKSRSLIQEYNSLDIELYDYFKKRKDF
jgi:hypothetical protein